jgi:hypothetical protein
VDFGLTIPGFYMEADRLPDSVSIGAFLGLVVSVVVSLVSQERSDLWASIRRLAWAGMVYMAGTLVAGVVATIALSIRHGVSSPDQMKNYLMPLGSTEGFVIGVVSLLATGFIGGIGLWRTLQYRRQAKPQKGPLVPPPLPPPARDASGDALPSPDEVSA